MNTVTPELSAILGRRLLMADGKVDAKATTNGERYSTPVLNREKRATQSVYSAPNGSPSGEKFTQSLTDQKRTPSVKMRDRWTTKSTKVGIMQKAEQLRHKLATMGPDPAYIDDRRAVLRELENFLSENDGSSESLVMEGLLQGGSGGGGSSTARASLPSDPKDGATTDGEAAREIAKLAEEVKRLKLENETLSADLGRSAEKPSQPIPNGDAAPAAADTADLAAEVAALRLQCASVNEELARERHAREDEDKARVAYVSDLLARTAKVQEERSQLAEEARVLRQGSEVLQTEVGELRRRRSESVNLETRTNELCEENWALKQEACRVTEDAAAIRQERDALKEELSKLRDKEGDMTMMSMNSEATRKSSSFSDVEKEEIDEFAAANTISQLQQRIEELVAQLEDERNAKQPSGRLAGIPEDHEEQDPPFAVAAPATQDCSACRLRGVMMRKDTKAADLRPAVRSVEVMLEEARHELASIEFRERRAAYEQLHNVVNGDDEDQLEAALIRARETKVDDEEIVRAENKLLELKALTPQMKAAKQARKLEVANKKQAYVYVKQDKAPALEAMLEGLDEVVKWEDWKDHAGRSLWICARDLRAASVQEMLTRLLDVKKGDSVKAPKRRNSSLTGSEGPFTPRVFTPRLTNAAFASNADPADDSSAPTSPVGASVAVVPPAADVEPKAVAEPTTSAEPAPAPAAASEAVVAGDSSSSSQASSPSTTSAAGSGGDASTEASVGSATSSTPVKTPLASSEESPQKQADAGPVPASTAEGVAPETSAATAPAPSADSAPVEATTAPAPVALTGAQEAEKRLQAFRCVVRDDCDALLEALEGVAVEVWENWRNKAGKSLLTLCEERGSSSAYAVIARELGMLKEPPREMFEERECVWIFKLGEVQPVRATVLEDTPPEADEILVEYWDGDDPPSHVERCQVRKIA
eukprot:TRINITY_DN60907_c0_g1_i1.p1 TRINITY_DN60907_c0_g1~~TRINITY_DN60907_c0_g1_i1.p1  ORF type:complete len:937 (+),score=227.11 TRINITY_DN60907_c0_g1_i1:183-2993(+)